MSVCEMLRTVVKLGTAERLGRDAAACSKSSAELRTAAVSKMERDLFNRIGAVLKSLSCNSHFLVKQPIPGRLAKCGSERAREVVRTEARERCELGHI